MISPNFDRKDAEDVAKAVAIAGLSALVTGLVAWGMDSLRQRLSPPKPADKPEP